ncbi:MAG: DUF3276 family protein [Chitinophagales bacterium]|jgi:hypothetical protein|nr:DUF3276 family protein [Chitinophagales bacterium]HNI44395.1 DUF3276 family protein [Chitinophagales bacterium]
MKPTHKNTIEAHSIKVKAGKRRTYFFDVKLTQNGEYYVVLTESLYNRDSGSYEKHKIHLNPEDFDKFLDGLHDAMNYIEQHYDDTSPTPDPDRLSYKADIDSSDVDVTDIDPDSDDLRWDA